ncbi:hypothetical protein ACOQFV_24480 [Nocardiopsis changdeensis]|uniref:Uncharacterized protein n=1 Tax=Nocardiopsis changdeensis TaxID=2831969 RepID=A0A975KTW2_9ACTN|nr:MULTISPECIES: hypothetical protein [Nocardiopsis]QUX26452.1 hypothetical protein KGD84_32660 [Nocardiopsis changdeensis]QYX40724.1 hypothetical protein K1J57_32510 [Nocardiopsis sp. MT53]
MSEHTTGQDRARAALTAYAADNDTRPGHELLTDLITDVLHVAAQAGINPGAVLDSTQRHLLEEAEEAEAADVTRATVRLRVVSFAGGRMDRAHLDTVLRMAIEALSLGVEQEDSHEPLYPWARVEHIEIHPDAETVQG